MRTVFPLTPTRGGHYSRLSLVLVVIMMAAAPVVPARAMAPVDTRQTVPDGPILFSTATGGCVPVVWQCMYDERVGDDIWRTDPDGSNVANLTNNPGAERDARSSPDASLIAFRSNRTGNDDLFLMDPNGGNLTQLTVDPAEDEFPTWSPDGRRIAYINNSRRTEDIVVMNSDGTRRRHIAAFPSIWGLSWSPNGKWIAFTKRIRGKNGWGPGNDQIYLIHPDGSGLRPLVRSRWFDEGYAEWAPGSRTLVFQRTSCGTGYYCTLDVWTVRADGSDLRRLTRTPDYDEGGARWSPDGTKIAYSSDEGDPGFGDVFVMNRDGSEQTRVLTRPESFDWVEDWAPAKE